MSVCLVAALAAVIASARIAPAGDRDRDNRDCCRACGPMAWKFGVMGDTQWTCPSDPDETNPNGVPVSIITQLNQEFINHGVEFVIEVGDLTEDGNDADEIVREAAAHELYDAGIGFFPFRGNHETYANPANDYAIPILQQLYPQNRGVGETWGAVNFSSPPSTVQASGLGELDGMSYSFDYRNVRFVIVDPFATATRRTDAAGYPYGYSIAEQQPWITSRLKHRRRGTHAFVFSHQNLMGENHQDCIFNGYTNANPDWQNAFYASLDCNEVGYYISGHDHIHQRSRLLSPDGHSCVRQLICQSDSSKFYTPKPLDGQPGDNGRWYGEKVRETSVSQERYTVGYYIFTVDGPRVTVDYYSDDHGNWLSDGDYPLGAARPDTNITPTFNFVKKETWGYSLSGKEFLVAQGDSYTVVEDKFESTKAKILDGTNDSMAMDYNLRPLTQSVNTGWTDVDGWCWACWFWCMRGPDCDLASDILTLWGMEDLGSEETAQFTLSMSYNPRCVRPVDLISGRFGLATRDEDGQWVNAADMNFGGTKKFVSGPWKPGYKLGTYGVDPKTKTVWAVINYNGEFVVARGIEARR